MGVRVVPLHKRETAQSMMRRLKKICDKERIPKEIKRHSYYEKPSERRRREKLNSLKRIQREREELQNPPKKKKEEFQPEY